MPAISVLMSVYNGERHILEAVNSILNQTFTDFEFIIVDNASTDQTSEILASLKDPRLKLIKNAQNLGQTKALNLGLKTATGEFIARMDADDVSLPCRLEEQLAVLKNNDSVVVVGAWHTEIDESGRILKTMKYPTDVVSLRCHLITEGNLTRRSLAHPTVMMRRSALEAVDGYSENIQIAQDYALWVRMLKKGDMLNIPKVLLNYRSSASSSSRKNKALMDAEIKEVIKQNIISYRPSMDSSTVQELSLMLQNKKPLTEQGDILNKFDDFFAAYINNWNASYQSEFISFQDRIKFYYLPRLFSVRPLKTIILFFKLIFKNPSFILDDKFFKNCAKVVLCR